MKQLMLSREGKLVRPYGYSPSPFESLPLDIICNILSRGFEMKELLRMETVSKLVRRASNEVNSLLIDTGCLTCDPGRTFIVSTLESSLKVRNFSQVQKIEFEGTSRDCRRCRSWGGVPASDDADFEFVRSMSRKLTLDRYVWSAEAHLLDFRYTSSSGPDLQALYSALSYCRCIEKINIHALYSDTKSSTIASTIPAIPTLHELKIISGGVSSDLLTRIVAGCQNLRQLELLCYCNDGGERTLVLELEQLQKLTLGLDDQQLSFDLVSGEQLQFLKCLREGMPIRTTREVSDNRQMPVP